MEDNGKSTVCSSETDQILLHVGTSDLVTGKTPDMNEDYRQECRYAVISLTWHPLSKIIESKLQFNHCNDAVMREQKLSVQGHSEGTSSVAFGVLTKICQKYFINFFSISCLT